MSDDRLRIMFWPHPCLRERALPYLFPADLRSAPGLTVGPINPAQTIELPGLFECLAVTLAETRNGIGLAATQVAAPIRVALIDLRDGKPALELVNPKILQAEGELRKQEGCLSMPGQMAHVDRYAAVAIEYFTRDGERKTLAAGGLMAHAIQHELDHLDGITLMERAGPMTRDKMKRAMRKVHKSFGGSWLPGGDKPKGNKEE